MAVLSAATCAPSCLSATARKARCASRVGQTLAKLATLPWPTLAKLASATVGNRSQSSLCLQGRANARKARCPPMAYARKARFGNPTRAERRSGREVSAKAALFFAFRSEGSAKAIIIVLLSHGDNNNYRLGAAVGSAATCAPLPVGRRAERCRLKPHCLYPLSLALVPFAPLGGTIVVAVLSAATCAPSCL